MRCHPRNAGPRRRAVTEMYINSEEKIKVLLSSLVFVTSLEVVFRFLFTFESDLFATFVKNFFE